MDATEQTIGQDAKITLPASGSVADREVQIVEPMHDVYGLKAKADALAFMEEPVTIMVHESTDPNAEPIVETFCNGIAQRFVRGRQQTVKRKFVAILAEAKPVGVFTREVLDNMGNRTTQITKHSALRYPFSVLEDKNPRGAVWLSGILNR
jgi:hypothetical protein